MHVQRAIPPVNLPDYERLCKALEAVHDASRLAEVRAADRSSLARGRT